MQAPISRQHAVRLDVLRDQTAGEKCVYAFMIIQGRDFGHICVCQHAKFT